MNSKKVGKLLWKQFENSKQFSELLCDELKNGRQLVMEAAERAKFLLQFVRDEKNNDGELNLTADDRD